MTILQHTNLNTILTVIYTFVDDFIKNVVHSVRFALTRPKQYAPPTRKHNLSIAELTSLAIFKFFTEHKSWKGFYEFIKTYHHQDFPHLPTYQNFLSSVNQLSAMAMMFLKGFMHVFKQHTAITEAKFADSTKLEVCHIKREFSHKVTKDFAQKSKGSMGWFYGFKLHIIANELMQILGFTITPANVDDRKGLQLIWKDIFGMIIADAGYLGKDIAQKASELGKILLAGVRTNMKKLMTATQYHLLKMRQKVEMIFSVLKMRMGLETSLPRSPLGHFAHYIWCINVYQLKKFLEFAQTKPLILSTKTPSFA